MRTIYKYEIPPFDKFELKLPQGAEILDFKVQQDRPVLWILHDTNNPTEVRKFVTHATEAEIPENEYENGDYLGTVLFSDDTLVSHLFEITDVQEQSHHEKFDYE